VTFTYTSRGARLLQEMQRGKPSIVAVEARPVVPLNKLARLIIATREARQLDELAARDD
jgi:hypothetical protein